MRFYTSRYELLDTTTNEVGTTEIEAGGVRNVEFTLELTTTGSADVAIQGHDGNGWVELKKTTYSASGNYEILSRAYPTYTKFRAVSTNVTTTTVLKVNMGIVG